jgi:hypothetical protein
LNESLLAAKEALNAALEQSCLDAGFASFAEYQRSRA